MRLGVANTLYSKLTPTFPSRAASSFRVDTATGDVKYDGERSSSSSSSSSDSDGEENNNNKSTNQGSAGNRAGLARSLRRVSAAAFGPGGGASSGVDVIETTPSGESAQHNLGLYFTPTPFLRPKVLGLSSTTTSSDKSYVPPPVVNASLVGCFDEGCLVLFGGSEGVAPSGQTWMYRIAERRWHRVDASDGGGGAAAGGGVDGGGAGEALAEARKARGFSGDRSPPARSGHTAVVLRDVRNVTRLDPATLQENAVAFPPSAEGLKSNAEDTANFGMESTVPLSSLRHHHHHHHPSDSAGSLLMSGSHASSTVGTESSTTGSYAYQPAMVVFGGADLSRGTYYNDLWLFDVELLAWRELKPSGAVPCPRWHHTAAVLEQRVFIYGGESSDFIVLDDLHVYDHILGAWRNIRTVQPIPPSRMLHSATVVGDHMVVIGGIGTRSNNASLMTIAVERSGVDPVSGRRDSTRRRRSVSTAVADGTLLERSSVGVGAVKGGDGAAASHQPVPKQEELSDVWLLNMRTLHWREIAKANKRFSPFVLREDIRQQQGNTIATAGSATGPTLAPPLLATTAAGTPAGVSYKSLEAHSALAFNERVLVFGGRLNGQLHRRLFSLHLPTETWAFLGELPTSQGNGELPAIRASQAACTVLERQSVRAMREGITLSQLEAAKRRLGEEHEALPFLEKLIAHQAAQISFTGVLSVYGTRPIVSRTVCGYVFGGVASSGKNGTDLWRLELDDLDQNFDFETLFGSLVDKLLSGRGSARLRRDVLLSAALRQADEEDDLDDETFEKLESYVLSSTQLSAKRAQLSSTHDGNGRSPPSLDYSRATGGGGVGGASSGLGVGGKRGSRTGTMFSEGLKSSDSGTNSAVADNAATGGGRRGAPRR